MPTPQERFNQAVDSYRKATQLLAMVDQAYQQVMFKDRPDLRHDLEQTLAQFDLILQLVLVNMAISDGRFDRLEQQFVEQITEYGDLMEALQACSNGTLQLSWGQLAAMDPRGQQLLVNTMRDSMYSICDAFVKPLALMDKAVERINLLQELEHYIIDIALQFSALDGNAEQREVDACCSMVMELLEQRWKEYLTQL